MTQFVVRLDEDLVAEVDALVEDGVAESRSDAVRRALRALIDRHRRRQTAEAIVAGYENRPQTAEDVGWTDAATVRMIAEEPW